MPMSIICLTRLRSVIARQPCHIPAIFDVSADEDHDKLSMLYGLPKLHSLKTIVINPVLLLT